MMKNKLSLLILLLYVCSCTTGSKTLWTIGTADNLSSEFALGPSGYADYMAHDFGFEDKYFLVGHSDIGRDFPYALPGPANTWGGSWGSSLYTHELNILFPLEHNSRLGSLTEPGRKTDSPSMCRFILLLTGVDSIGSVLKLDVNGLQSKRFDLQPSAERTESSSVLSAGQCSKADTIVFEFPSTCLLDGGNNIKISVLEGGWVVFDELHLETSPDITMSEIPNQAYLRSVSVADYETDSLYQPLLVDIEHLSGRPEVTVKLDGESIFSQKIDSSRYIFEAPMPKVESKTISQYQIEINGKTIDRGKVVRNKSYRQSLADYVDTKMGTGHSRWMIAPGPWMPFSMVKLSPDNQNPCWQSGYQPTFENIGCFSHIHEWTMSGLGVMPTNGKLEIHPGDEHHPDEGYRSRIDKRTEKSNLGKYEVLLTDTGIKAEMTATCRASFMKFTFPDSIDGRIMIDMMIPAEYSYQLKDVNIKQSSDYTIDGTCHQLTPNVWSSDANQDYTINFHMEFDRPVKNTGCWKNDSIYHQSHISGKELNNAGMYVEFDTKDNPVVQVRTGMSYVSQDNAALNLRTEISDCFGWDFDAVVQNQKDTWNDILDRIKIRTSDRLEKVRFYTNLYRAHCRNIFSDVNGQWMTPDEIVSQLSDKNDVALGCDAFWNTFWNLNQVWNLITPEWSSRWVHSQLAMYDACGWLAKGPAGMQYIPVMVAEHEIPLLVSAYQMGIRDYDAEKLLSAALKMQTTPAQRLKGGFAGNRDLVPYMKYHYVPYELGLFSNSLEYSFDDWTLGQLAKSLGKEDIYRQFNERGSWWKNTFNSENGFAHVRDREGHFLKDFDPFNTNIANRCCYTEGNAWQLSFFVPQNPEAMIETIGRERFLDRLQWGFSQSEVWRYNAPNERYDAYPVVQGNQQSMHFAFLFNWAGKPWLTQKWSRSIVDRYYGYGNVNAYLGDEDQGQMSAWFIMAALGLFQTDGGCKTEPQYEIASPIFEEVNLDLGQRYGRGKNFRIVAEGVSRKAIYVQSAVLNGKPLNSFRFPASELLSGGELIIKMGEEPNYKWGTE